MRHGQKKMKKKLPKHCNTLLQCITILSRHKNHIFSALQVLDNAPNAKLTAATSNFCYTAVIIYDNDDAHRDLRFLGRLGALQHHPLSSPVVYQLTSGSCV